MPLSTIALLYASPSCSAPHQINSHASYDVDVNARSPSSASTSPSHKPLIGGLSCLFSPQSLKSATYSDEVGTLWHDGSEEMGSSSRYFSLCSSQKRDHGRHSPVSVLQGPSSSILPSSRSPPKKIGGDLKSVSGVLFNGFTRHAVVSSVSYDSSSLAFNMNDVNPSSSNILTEDLTFTMDDNDCTLLDLPPYAKDLLVDAQSKHTIFRDDDVVKAFYEAEKAHRGQMRASGHPYLQHCLETAKLLASIGATSTVVAAGLLHDTVDDSFLTYGHISKSCGTEIADLVEGVSKLSQLSKLARENNMASKTVEADQFHTMYLGMADARAVLIKLADRLHNMITLDALPLIKQQRFAKETLEIFAPLANRLGISSWKEQLENLCFENLYPDQYQELSSKIVKSFDKTMITCSVEKLEQALTAGAVSYNCLSGRHKSLYSIYSKMLKKKLSMDEIHDIHGLRLIVETKEDCYKALRIVRQLWPEVPGRFKDYIASPKVNGYQSLHTVAVGDDMVPLEVQIRSKEMHLQAEYGFAAHWRYKEGESKHSSYFLQMVEWARWIVTFQCDSMNKDMTAIGFVDSMKPPCTFLAHSEDCPFSCKPYCSSDAPIFIIVIENDKMSVKEFPANSSVMDILERTDRGKSRLNSYLIQLKGELRLRLNHESLSDLTCKLKMGDVVELTPTIPVKSLTECREEIQRMYNQGTPISSAVPAATTILT